MTKATVIGRASGPVLLILALGPGCGPFGDEADAAGAGADTGALAAHPSFLYGRVTTVDGDTYEGRIRFGGTQEAFWGDHFNGFRAGNPWVDQVPDRAVWRSRPGIRLFGIEIRLPGSGNALRREFMTRFGDIVRIEAEGRDLRVTLKSGTVVELDRYSADDFADGVRVWDAKGVVDLSEGKVRSIDLFSPAEGNAEAPYRLHGTVHTPQGDFTGFLQWGMEGSVGLDELDGYDVDGELVSVPYVTIRSVTRLSNESARVTLLDGTHLELSDTREIGERNRGIYVDDARYGRVLVPWNAFDSVDLTPVGAVPGAGPSYDDFPAGSPLFGTVTDRAGRHHTGRLVYDLDESEATETLDAPSRGVTYTIPFGLVGSIDVGSAGHADGRALVRLRTGEVLEVERGGDLGVRNAGILIFGEGDTRAYVGWPDVVRVDFSDRQ